MLLSTPGISFSISYLTESKKELLETFDITYGLKITLIGSYHRYKNNSKTSNEGSFFANLGFETNFNFKTFEKTKFYFGLEGGIGVGIYTDKEIDPDFAQLKNKFNIFPNLITKLSLGGKINDKYNIAVYMGVGKGILGIESGYIF